MSAEWDVAFTQMSGRRSLVLSVPAAIGETLVDRGMFRAKVTITKYGILLRPYVAPAGTKRQNTQSVDLPDWGDPS